MLIGLLITILFFSEVEELFFIKEMDKAVKENVVDKDRQKTILAELKVLDKGISEYNKKRKKVVKEFKAMSMDRNITRAEFDTVAYSIHGERLENQELVIQTRRKVQELIEPDEWQGIIDFAEERFEKESAKKKKKQEKGKLKAKIDFEKFAQKVDKTITDPQKKEKINALYKQVRVSLNELNQRLEDLNVAESETIAAKTLTESEMRRIFGKTNELRKTSYEKYMALRFELLELTDEHEWKAVIQEFNDLIQARD